MSRKMIDLTYLELNPTIAEWLKDNFVDGYTPKDEKTGKVIYDSNTRYKGKIKRYFSALNRMGPDIIKKYKTLKRFFELDENKKSNFFKKWCDDKTEETLKIHPERKRKTVKKSFQVIYWTVQGLLSSLGSKYKANVKGLEQINSDSNHVLHLTKEDLEKLYKVMNHKYQLILKTMFFLGGLNPKDIVSLTLNDFEEHDSHFYILSKERQKTKRKGGRIFNIIHKEFYEELKEFAKLKSRGDNESIFSRTKQIKDQNGKVIDETQVQMVERTISDTFRNHIESHTGISKEATPKYIRQLAATLLKKVLPQDLLLLWTQHKTHNIVDQHYDKSPVERMIKLYDEIVETVLIGNGYLKMVKADAEANERVYQLENKLAETEKKLNKATQTITLMSIKLDKIVEMVEKNKK